MAEKGNAADVAMGALAGSAGGLVVEDVAARTVSMVGDTVTSTVTTAGETMRNKIVDRAADHTIDEARDRLKERRERPLDEELPE